MKSKHVLCGLTILILSVGGLLSLTYPRSAQAGSPTTTPTTIPTVTANKQWTPVEQTFDSVAMVLVPPSCFMMGTTVPTAGGPVTPVTKICFEKPFWIDKYEVTNIQFAQLGGQAVYPSLQKSNNWPREYITWFEARDFCVKRGAWLPTEAEWEYAARGPDNLFYPWGNRLVYDNVVDGGNSGGGTNYVGSKPGGVSWVGAYDLSGNVWEWTHSLYKPYPYNAADGRESDDKAAGPRSIRGGGLSSGHSLVNATSREWGGMKPSVTRYDIGFRCARSY
jgi:formylglycine-generating enzyme required for sulfatase activity